VSIRDCQIQIRFFSWSNHGFFHGFPSTPVFINVFDADLVTAGYSLHPEAADTGQQQAGLPLGPGED